MRRSLRKIDSNEAAQYDERDQIFTVSSLEEARQRLISAGLDPSTYCFFSWMKEGIRYYRVWEDKRLKDGIVKAVPFGEVATRLKRADAEKLYTVAKRFVPGDSPLRFETADGTISVIDASKDGIAAVISVPLVGGDLRVERLSEAACGWNERQVAHFLNVILMRGHHAAQAFFEASNLR